ncbi:MAG: protein translocase subunit SecD [Spirochaetes bacterium]|nr:protein translocase subunit SecD [Spirochaetota bacterium]
MKKRTRYFIFLFSVLFGVYFLVPTVRWYFLFSEKDRNEARVEGDKLQKEVNIMVNETLDQLKKEKALGIKLVAINKAFKKELKMFNRAIEQNNRDIINYNKENPDSTMELENIIEVKKSFTYEEMRKILLDVKGKEKYVDAFFKNVLEDYYIEYFKEKKKIKNSIIKLGLDLQGGAYAVVTVRFNHPKMKERYPEGIPKHEKEAMIDSAIIMIQNRINKYGLSETSIQKLKEQEKIIISLPGVKEATELRQIVETVGVLDFKLVSKEGSDILYNMKMEADKKGKRFLDQNGKLLPEYQAKLMAELGNPNVETLLTSNKDKWGKEQDERGMLVVEKESLLGENIKITAASVDQSEFGQSVVNFTLGDEDAKEWARVTENNINREIAIILDDIILHAPVVRDKIPNGRSQVTLGNAPAEELRTLALILRSGSLSVPLEISEEHTVGASLGRDTIEKGLYAVLFGFIFVLIFMVIWYNAGGIIADLAMILNLILLMGGLALFKGTLTLPGIAGIILTVGMAVDANVIIFERIKEEYRAGKTFKTAVNLGFNKAFWTIVDANLTTFAAGIGLSLFGTGPIKGFAVTLCLGIMVSLFTSLFVSRLIFDTLVNIFEFKSLRLLSLFRGK